jgi:hypothetical protein
VNLIADPANVIERFAFRILERPVVALEARHVRALVTAPHGDKQ